MVRGAEEVVLRTAIITGSTRARSNAELLAVNAAGHLQRKGIHVHLIRLREYRFGECMGCRRCVEIKKCCIMDDMTEKIIPLIMKAHIIIVSSPVYFDNVTALVKKNSWIEHGVSEDFSKTRFSELLSSGEDMAWIQQYSPYIRGG